MQSSAECVRIKSLLVECTIVRSTVTRSTSTTGSAQDEMPHIDDNADAFVIGASSIRIGLRETRAPSSA